MNFLKILLLTILCASVQAQSIQEQQQNELKKKQDVAEKYKRFNEDQSQLREAKEQMVKDGAYIVVCERTNDSLKSFKGFAFYKGALWEYHGSVVRTYYNPLGKYVKKGDTLSWQETNRVDNLGYEVNTTTNQYFYQRLSTKQIWGPKQCEAIQEIRENL